MVRWTVRGGAVSALSVSRVLCLLCLGPQSLSRSPRLPLGGLCQVPACGPALQVQPTLYMAHPGRQARMASFPPHEPGGIFESLTPLPRSKPPSFTAIERLERKNSTTRTHPHTSYPAGQQCRVVGNFGPGSLLTTNQLAKLLSIALQTPSPEPW